MAVVTVTDTLTHNPELAAYFASPSTDRRIRTGFRLALEWLGLPIPDYARRGEAGRIKGVRQITAAYNADHGTGNYSKHIKGTSLAQLADNGWQGRS
jgi:hypothetical protein